MLRPVEEVVREADAHRPRPGYLPLLRMPASPAATVLLRVLEVLRGAHDRPFLTVPGEIAEYRPAPGRRPPYREIDCVGREPGCGACYARRYREDTEYLLLLKGGTPYWAPLAPTNEEISGARAIRGWPGCAPGCDAAAALGGRRFGDAPAALLFGAIVLVTGVRFADLTTSSPCTLTLRPLEVPSALPPRLPRQHLPGPRAPVDVAAPVQGFYLAATSSPWPPFSTTVTAASPTPASAGRSSPRSPSRRSFTSSCSGWEVGSLLRRRLLPAPALAASPRRRGAPLGMTLRTRSRPPSSSPYTRSLHRPRPALLLRPRRGLGGRARVSSGLPGPARDRRLLPRGLGGRTGSRCSPAPIRAARVDVRALLLLVLDPGARLPPGRGAVGWCPGWRRVLRGRRARGRLHAGVHGDVAAAHRARRPGARPRRTAACSSRMGARADRAGVSSDGAGDRPRLGQRLGADAGSAPWACALGGSEALSPSENIARVPRRTGPCSPRRRSRPRRPARSERYRAVATRDRHAADGVARLLRGGRCTSAAWRRAPSRSAGAG